MGTRRRRRKWQSGCARMAAAAAAAMTAAGGGGAGAARSLSRFRGCLAGALLGDCVGAIYEAHDTVSLTSVLRHVQSLEPDPGTPGSARTGGRAPRQRAGRDPGLRATWSRGRGDPTAEDTQDTGVGGPRFVSARLASTFPQLGRAALADVGAPRRRSRVFPAHAPRSGLRASPRATQRPRSAAHLAALTCLSCCFLVLLSLFGPAHHSSLPSPSPVQSLAFTRRLRCPGQSPGILRKGAVVKTLMSTRACRAHGTGGELGKETCDRRRSRRVINQM